MKRMVNVLFAGVLAYDCTVLWRREKRIYSEWKKYRMLKMEWCI